MATFQKNLDHLLAARFELAAQHGAAVERLLKQSDAMQAAGALEGQEPQSAVPPDPDRIEKLYGQCASVLKKLRDLEQSLASSGDQRTQLQQELKQFLNLIVEYLFRGTRRAKIASLESRMDELGRQALKLKGQLGKGLAYQQAQTAGLITAARQQLSVQTDKTLTYVRRQEPSKYLGWSAAEAWNSWTPPEGVRLPTQLRIGEFEEQSEQVFRSHLSKSGLDGDRLLSKLGPIPAVTLPAFLPFLGAEQCYVIECNESSFAPSVAFLNSLLLRISTLLPNQCRFTLIDPSGHGRSFPLRRILQDVRESEEQVYAELRSVVRDIRRINEDVLGLIERFDLLPDATRASEKYEFIFCADFPNGYDRRAIDEIFNVAATGPRAGRYVFIHFNQSHPLPRDVTIESLKNAIRFRHDAHPAPRKLYQYQPDRLPSESLVQETLTKIDDSKPPEHALVWKNVSALPVEQWWGGNSERIIQTPVGGNQQEMDVWFGVNEEGRPCAHGMLGAMTGSGKSNLYHVLILGLSIRYSPEELQVYLIDGKDGVEFQPYQSLPHATVVSLKSSPELSRSVLAELIDEKSRRNALFSEHKVRDFSSYRAKVQPLPRILLLIDEYQELFEDDPNGEASANLLQIAQQGRSAGIHMLLGSQQFGAPGMLNQSAILGNVHLRMAMKMDYAKVQSLTEFGPRGKSLIRSCDLPGKIVINDKTGEDSGNRYGKVALIATAEQEQVVAELARFAEQQGCGRSPIVFHGADQPQLLSQAQIKRFAQSPTGSAAEVEKIARSPVAESGFGVPDWTVTERPLAAWVGQEFTVRGGSPVVLRRVYGHNAAIVGANKPCREGILAGMLVSIASVCGAGDAEFVFFDRSLPDESCPSVPATIHQQLLQPSGFESSYYAEESDLDAFLEQLTEQLAGRQAAADEGRASKSILAVINEPNRSASLRRSSSRFSKESNTRLETLLKLAADGPQHGIHLLVLAAGMKLLGHAFDERRDLEFFNHRFALQMSEDDSFAFVGSRKAAQLQKHGSQPVVALYANNELGVFSRFKPFSLETDETSLTTLRQLLAEKSETANA